ncbi:MAG: class I SAM-dependent methyltransferase [Akkermansia sp.]
MDISTCSRPLQCAQAWVASLVQKGDTVVDATAGNGYDSLFLAQLIGETGTLHLFDIQACALSATRDRLSLHGYEGDWISFHQASHATMAELIPAEAQIKAIMFNLGYLPGGDKTLVSQEGETIKAIESAMSLVAHGGIVTIVCYPGHQGGDAEALAVQHMLASVSASQWRIAQVSHWNAPSPAPFLLAAFKLK